MTWLVASIVPETMRDLSAGAARAFEVGADAVEVRIDAFGVEPGQLNAFLQASAERRWIVTCRTRREGGHSDASASERAAALASAARGTTAYVDFEEADWSGSSLSDDLRRDLLEALHDAPGGGKRLIFSVHNPAGAFEHPPRELRRLLTTPNGCAAKLVYQPRNIVETFAAFDLLREHGARAPRSAVGDNSGNGEGRHRGIVSLAMGEDGLWTRVLAKKLGAFASYSALDDSGSTAPGQASLDRMIGRYRWPVIDDSTRVFGAVGDPVAHSMGPVLFNRWFGRAGINAVYLPLRVRRDADCLVEFLEGCRRRPWLDVTGLSVTIPHKTKTLQWLCEAADHTSRQVGAVNTLHFDGVRVRGYNTDVHAAVGSLCAALDRPLDARAGMSVHVLGAGGAARAVVYGLTMHGFRVSIFARSTQRARTWSDACGATLRTWGEREHGEADVLVNCTSVGMWPAADSSPMPREALNRYGMVFDLVYNPPETRLLRDAAAAGAGTLSGLDMFIRQAAAQFELWTGHVPDPADAAECIRSELHRLRNAADRAGTVRKSE